MAFRVIGLLAAAALSAAKQANEPQMGGQSPPKQSSSPPGLRGPVPPPAEVPDGNPPALLRYLTPRSQPAPADSQLSDASSHTQGLQLSKAAPSAGAMLHAMFDVAPAMGLGPKGSARPEQAQGSASSCECLNWKSVYSSKAVKCGAGNEFAFATGKNGLSGFRLARNFAVYGNDHCWKFYQKLDNNFCTNMNIGVDKGQWCYVSSQCNQLGGGHALNNTNVSWKMCTKTDRRLRDFKPEQLEGVSLEGDLDLGLLHKMSFPLYKGHMWKEVEPFWGPGNATEMMPRTLIKEMQVIANIGHPYSFDTSTSGSAPFMIVDGNVVYELKKVPKAAPNRPSSWLSMRCRFGCKPGE